MDPLGALQAALALAVYPGGAFLAAAAWLLWRTSGARPGSGALGLNDGVALAAAVAAAALASMPGSPAAQLPVSGGPGPNLVIAVTLLGAGIALGAPGAWGRLRLSAATVAVVPAALLAAGAATLAMPTINAAPGSLFLAARAAAAAAALSAAPALCSTFGEGALPVRMALTGAIAVIAAGLVVPAQGSAEAAAVAAVAVLGAVGLYGLLLRLCSRLVPAAPRTLTSLGAMFAAVAVSVTAVAAR